MTVIAWSISPCNLRSVSRAIPAASAATDRSSMSDAIPRTPSRRASRNADRPSSANARTRETSAA
ncbi:MAG: hypothetical protein K0S70_2183 [Microbacterium sp.]|nr:hypothetical protein [Microbacterium sp.]